MTTRFTRQLWMLGLGLLGAAACSTLDVKTNYNPSANFAQYRTYAWLPVQDRSQAAQLFVGSPAEGRLKGDVAQALAKRGIVPAAQGQRPDFLISYHVGTEQKVNVTDWGYGWGPWMGPDVSAYSYTQGTLILDFVDPNTQQAFWRGYASDVINDPGSGGSKIDEAVAKMLEKYPPPQHNVAAVPGVGGG
jgi:hypothetical protein